MRMMKKAFCAMTAALMFISAAPANLIASADAEEKIKPVFQYFNPADVNGSVVIVLPEEIHATAEITFDSPEGIDEPYYRAELAANGTYSFAIEGRDTTDDGDFRDYNLKITAVGGEFSDQTAIYIDKFNVPDKNDNPDSFAELRYIFKVDDVVSKSDWDVSTDETGAKVVSLHNNSFMYGDVNDSKSVNSSDASDVLAEYSSRATSGESILTEKRRKAADVNGDSKVDSKDASDILAYYSALSTGDTPKWKVELMKEEEK